MKSSLLALGIGTLLLSASSSWAQNYPNKPITLVVPYAAGGATDSASRMLANKLKDVLGQPVIIENKPGAGTVVAAAAVTRAPKDGYTLMMITASTVATAPHLHKTLTYKPEDLAPVSMVVKVPMVLAAKKDLQIKTVKEFVEYAKANPGALTYSTSGTGSTTHLAGELLSKFAGIKMREVPYRSSSLGMNDVMGGNVDLCVESVSLTAPQHDAGNLRVIASFSDRRSDQLPNVPTFKESGLPKVVADTWFAVAVPAGTSPDIIKKLSEAIRTALADPDTSDKLRQAGFFPEASTPEELGALIKQEYEVWGEVIAGAQIPKLD